jgi:D-aminoacyl-tRNA deacylase
MKMIVIVISKKDVASVNISRALLTHAGWHEKGDFQHGIAYGHKSLCLVIIRDLHLHHDHIDQQIRKELKINPSVIIFASRHTSRSQKKTLSVHPLGNYGEALYGGKHHTLIPSAPLLMTRALRKLYEKKNLHKLEYDVCYEVTHHGPYLSTPSFFIEIGSSALDWNNETVAQVIAEVLLEIPGCRMKKDEIAIGIGGGHYAPRFSDIALKKQLAFGHMVPGYHQDSLNESMIDQLISSTPNVKIVYFHGKATSSMKTCFEEKGLRIH